MTKQKIYFAAIAGLTIIGSVYAWQFMTKPHGDRTTFEDLGISFEGSNSFVVDEDFEPQYSDRDEHLLYAHGPQGNLHMSVISEMDKKQKEEYAQMQFLLFDSMYDQKLPPYPEFLTKATGCPDEYLPKRHESRIGEFYTIYADSRFNLGVCAEEVASYKAGLGVFYCENTQKVLKISYFVDKSNDYDIVGKFMNSITCKQ